MRKQMKSKANREISQFKGDAAVIGCSNNHSYCDKKNLFHPERDNFYSIDMEADQGPDFVFNMTNTLPEELKDRFKLTLVECIDFIAYNEPINKRMRSKNGRNGFQNILDITQHDGVIVIIGCPRLKEYRNELHQRQLKYIELDDKNECILIPKNQELSIEELQENISQMEPYIVTSINNAKILNESKPKEPFVFCNENYETMDTLQTMYKNTKNEITSENNQFLARFIKIYNALYDGQTSLFQGKRRVYHSMNEVNEYINTHPKSRTSAALTIALKFPDTDIKDKELIFDIHQYAYKHSSTFFIFKRTKINSSNDIDLNSNGNRSRRIVKIINSLS